MATIPVVEKPTPVTISKFLGLNSNEESETQLTLGEACEMNNIRIGEGYKLEQVCGYDLVKGKTATTDTFAKRIFKIPFNKGKEELLVYVKNKQLVILKDDTEKNPTGMTLDDIEELYSVFAYKDYYYVLLKDEDDNHQYLKFSSSDNGTTFTISDATTDAYVPLIAIGTAPAGGGTDYEQINLLSNKRRQSFSPDGEATAFQLRETSIASVISVTINDTATSDYTVNTSTGVVTFTTAPSEGSDTVEITYSVTADSESIGYVTKNKNVILYGDGQDTHIFMWGNEDRPSTIIYSDLGDLVARADYFPANNFLTLGDGTSSITGVTKQYDRLVIAKPDCMFYAEYEDLETTDSSGNTVTLTALKNYPLNDTVGCSIVEGQQLLQLLNNYPVTVNDNGMYRITQTNVRAETNASYISQRVQDWFEGKTLNSAFDYEAKHEYWIHGYTLDDDEEIDVDEWLIYNYELDIFYKFSFPDFIYDLVSIGEDLYFLTEDGLFKFNEDREVFGYGLHDHDVTGDKKGLKIESYWEMGYYNFGYEYKRKMLTRLWVSLQPYLNSNVDIDLETDRGNGSQTYPIDIIMTNFADVNFGRYSFDTVYNPKPRRLKAKAKKFVYLKVKLSNNEWKTRFKILQLTLQWQLGGEAK